MSNEANVLSKYEIEFNPMNMGETLWAATRKYEAIIADLTSQREGMADAESRVRNNWAENPEMVQLADVLVSSFLNICREHIENEPRLTAALYQAVAKKLSDNLKSERDYAVMQALKTDRKVPVIPGKDIAELREVIETLFTMCNIMKSLPVDYPVKFSEKTNLTTPNISRKPKETTRPNGGEAISKRFIWTVDGKVYEDSPAGMRKILGVDKVPDIFPYFQVESRGSILTGNEYSATINGKRVTMQVVEPPQIDTDDDEDDTDDED